VQTQNNIQEFDKKIESSMNNSESFLHMRAVGLGFWKGVGFAIIIMLVSDEVIPWIAQGAALFTFFSWDLFALEWTSLLVLTLLGGQMEISTPDILA
jgi:hypothetical protein